MKLHLNVPDWATAVASDLTDMNRNPHPVDARKVVSFALELPADVYFEYAFVDEAGKMRADPERAERADNPWYGEVSAVYGPKYESNPYASPDELPVGETKRLRLESRHLKQTKRVSIYTPKGYEDKPLPVVYVQDGVALYRYVKLHLMLENLLRDTLVRPARLVFLEPTDRTQEYGFNDLYQKFVLEEALPEVEQTVSVTDERIALGASLGGLASVLLALNKPELFRSVVTFSGAFLGTPTEKNFYKSKKSWVLDELRERKKLPLRFYTEVGTLEWLTDINRKVTQVLDERGYEHLYAERSAGHNWTNWKNGIQGALTFALDVK